jgi:hypothetical protein
MHATLTFPEMVIATEEDDYEKQTLEEIQLWRELKIMTRKQAVQQLRPDFTEEQIAQWIKDLEIEEEADFEKMLMGMPTSSPERKTDGTFNEGNEAAAEPDIETKN